MESTDDPQLTVSDSANHIHTATVRFSSGGDQVSQNSGTTITRPYSLHCDIIPHTIWIMHTAFINERRTQGAGCQIYTRYMVSNSENTSILNVFYFNTVCFHYMVQKESWDKWGRWYVKGQSTFISTHLSVLANSELDAEQWAAMI